jgi:hypothetical protein
MELRELPDNRAVVLKNITCPYCGIAFGASGSTREHLVGRRFVPRGKLNQSWNLILRACASCNNHKSELEDDLSALTMQPDVWGRHAHKDQDLEREAVRKGANSFSRRTGKAIDQSRESVSIEASPMSGVTMKLNFTGPAYTDSERAFELARLQLSGLFYWITFDPTQRKGGFWLEGFWPFQYTFRADWGNQFNRSFMNEISNWQDRLLVSTNGGFFKARIKRHPAAPCWSWALEWNHSLRLIGFFGDRSTAQDVVNSFPSLEHHDLNDEWRFREEIRLVEEDDILFS